MTPLKVAVLTAVATLAGAGLAEAGSSQGKVRACSSYGNGCYTAPVRQGKWGREMRLRGGTWIDCRAYSTQISMSASTRRYRGPCAVAV